MDYDFVVVGAGHNALISAAYLAMAGYRVGVFERQSRCGGAVRTEARIPSYKFDLGGSAHILIRLTPIVDELNLENHGLDYIDIDTMFYAPTDRGAFFTHRSIDRTASGIEDLYPGEGDNYLRFINDWLPFSESVLDTFLSSPSPLELGKAFAVPGTNSPDWEKALPQVLRPYGEVLDDYFTAEGIKAPLVWMAAQSGPPPSEALSAPFLLWHPLYHKGGLARPRGGSGELTQALQRMIEAHGGDVHTNAAVDRILVDGGRASGVVVEGVPYTSKAVLAGTHVLESMGRLLPEAYRPQSLSRMRTGNGFGAIVRLALSSPVEYRAQPIQGRASGLQLLCRDRQQIQTAYGDFMKGVPAEDPPLVAMTFSTFDDALAPPGGEVLWLWAQYYPYALAGGASWYDIADEVEASIIDQFEHYAPGTRDKIVGSLFQHPAYLERELGLFRGNVMHLEMSIDQMFMMRPALDLSSYRTHIPNLYLTGASTHPGGGIMGASGRNAARVILADQ